jgi:hypothetical protein
MPKEFTHHALTAEMAISFLQTGQVECISFDHDLGTDETGYTVAKYIERAVYDREISCPKWKVHSANPVGVENIRKAMASAEKIQASRE